MDIREKFNGVFAPITTPFDERDHVSIPSLISNIYKYNETDLKGYMPLGSNGEFQGLTDEESLAILKAVQQCKSKDKTIVAGCGRESSYKTIEFLKQVADYGLDMGFVIPPHYFASRMTNDALKAYYFAVADKSPIPIVAYNAPKFAFNLIINVDLMLELASHPNIVAMKNSSLEPNKTYITALGDRTDFHIIAGNIKTFYPGMCDGTIGGVLSTASYLPEYCCNLYKHFINGNQKGAQKLHEFLNKLSSDTIGMHGVAGVKLGLDYRGLIGGDTRLPLLPIPNEEKRRIMQYLEELGIGQL